MRHYVILKGGRRGRREYRNFHWRGREQKYISSQNSVQIIQNYNFGLLGEALSKTNKNKTLH